MKIKESIKLNKIIDRISDYTDVSDYGCAYDFIGDMDADCYAMENQDKCRADHFDSHIIDGAAMMEKSIKTGNPIYRVYAQNADIIFYFVGDMQSIREKLNAKLEQVAKRYEDLETKEIHRLEKRLTSLKKNKKTSR
jgi:hypothetical protein